MVEIINALDHLGQDHMKLLKPTGGSRTLFADLKNLTLGLIENLTSLFTCGIERLGRDLVAHRYKVSENRSVTNNFRITPNIGGRGRFMGEGVEIRDTPNLIGTPDTLQRLVNGDDVCRSATINKLGNTLKNDTMVGPIEIIRPHHIADLLPGRVIKQKAP